MQEPATRLFTDSILTESFSTRSSSLDSASGRGGGGSQMWFIGPAIVFAVVALMVGMLVFWWLRCNKKKRSFRGGMSGVGSSGVHQQMMNGNGAGNMAKMALSSSEFNNGVGAPTETSKLLLGMDSEGRPVMNSYDRHSATLNDTLNLFPDSGVLGSVSYSNLCNPNRNSTSVSQQRVSGVGDGGGGGFSLTNPSNMMLHTSTSMGICHSPIPLTEFATHIDRLKMNNNELFIQVRSLKVHQKILFSYCRNSKVSKRVNTSHGKIRFSTRTRIRIATRML